MTLNKIIDECLSVSRSLSTGDIELYIDNTKKVQGVELSRDNNGNLYCNITTRLNTPKDGKKITVEREVKIDAGGYPYIDATELYDYEKDVPLAKAGDKVKVIIMTK